MSLIKIGAVTITLDRATCIRDLSRIHAAGALVCGLWRIEFEGGRCVEVARGSEALRHWLATHVTDLSPAT